MYVEVLVSRSVSVSPLEFEITRVDYTLFLHENIPVYFGFSSEAPQCGVSKEHPHAFSCKDKFLDWKKSSASVQADLGIFVCLHVI